MNHVELESVVGFMRALESNINPDSSDLEFVSAEVVVTHQYSGNKATLIWDGCQWVVRV